MSLNDFELENGYPERLKTHFDAQFPSSTPGFRKAFYELVAAITNEQLSAIGLPHGYLTKEGT